MHTADHRLRQSVSLVDVLFWPILLGLWTKRIASVSEVAFGWDERDQAWVRAFLPTLSVRFSGSVHHSSIPDAIACLFHSAIKNVDEFAMRQHIGKISQTRFGEKGRRPELGVCSF
eukprot:2730112-Rhodomonas_salina.2